MRERAGIIEVMDTPEKSDRCQDSQVPQANPRGTLRVARLVDQGKEDDLVGTTAEQRLQMMWPLALTAWAFMGEDGSEQELPRRFARLIRRKR